MNTSKEWLETDGLGGFASGTANGIRTRRYHALLLTATTPPTGRLVLVNGFDAWVETPNGKFALTSQRYDPDVISPDAAEAPSVATEPVLLIIADISGYSRFMTASAKTLAHRAEDAAKTRSSSLSRESIFSARSSKRQKGERSVLIAAANASSRTYGCVHHLNGGPWIAPGSVWC